MFLVAYARGIEKLRTLQLEVNLVSRWMCIIEVDAFALFFSYLLEWMLLVEDAGLFTMASC